MIPLRDNIPSRTTPAINYLIIAICSLTFLIQVSSEDQGSGIVERYGMIPARLADPHAKLVVQQQVLVQTPFGIEQQTLQRELAPAAIPAWMTVVTCMFLHGGWMHFLGNMWFLYVFGDNVEDRLGRLGYLLMYLGTGVVAALAHHVTDDASVIPTIGASGAIAGVMGAYAWLYPHARVQALLPLVVIILPAPIFLGIWFAIQTYSGIAASASGHAGGVAWWAHIGGFVAGILIALAVGRAHLGRAAVADRRF